MNNVNLVIFTCEGREHLLKETYDSFQKNCDFSFDKKILAIDGQIEPAIIFYIQPDIIIQSFERQGYVNNIKNALSILTGKYFFWLEDDWHFPYQFSINNLIKPILDDESVIQVVLSKNNTDEVGFKKFNTEYYITNTGFSANPCLCQTNLVKKGFLELSNFTKNNPTIVTGFENYLTLFMEKLTLKTLYKLHNDKAFVSHSGYLESSPREYHMINSLNNTKKYITGLGINVKLSILNKISMFFKLVFLSLYLAIGQIFSRRIYDFSFRIYRAYKSTLRIK